MLNAYTIKNIATQMGFDLCGITPAQHLRVAESRFREWQACGYGDPLEYLSKYEDVRFDCSKLVPNAKCVVVCAVSYKSEYSVSGQANSDNPKIASYALNRDYHKSIRHRLKAMLTALKSEYPNLSGRVFTDSAPLLEKQLAVNAGLGWIGRQSLLITPEYGSFILLGELVLDMACDTYDSEQKELSCGSCRQCIDHCPVIAINDNRTIDARRCISCRTVEVDNPSDDLTLAGWIFGCDECQSCCPHNQRAPMHTNPDFDPIIHPISASEWLRMGESEFIEKFGTTPLKRATLLRLQRAVTGTKRQ
ncbi:MAG: tRNA epoxyqueuosine(34) reductase QueG [Rikenellaceae bacterium]